VRLLDPPVLIDDIGDATRVFILRARRRAVREADTAVGVAEQREGEVELLREARVRIDVIETHAEDLSVFCGVLIVEVPEPGTLERSARCVGLRIKPEHDLLAGKISELHALTVMVRRIEVGRFLSNLQHRCTSEDSLRRETEHPGERHVRDCNGLSM
jgi:hypothetical protein